MILDEPTAALDVSVQAVILQLLDRLRREEGIGLLFVSHDLNVVRMLCEDLVVLQAGKVVEAGPSAAIFQRPQDAYTRALLDAVPYFDPQRRAAEPPTAHHGARGRNALRACGETPRFRAPRDRGERLERGCRRCSRPAPL